MPPQAHVSRTLPLNLQQRHILGLDASALVEFGDHRLLPETHAAFTQLAEAASHDGFDLRIASAYRSYERQRLIWNGKLEGSRPVVDDQDQPVDVSSLSVQEKLAAVLRFSALPGTSRHHWGTDIDVYDQAAVPDDYVVQLNACEVDPGGCFAPFHDWLDERIQQGRSYGFYRPYDRDRGGVACERWHLSFAPRAADFSTQISASLIRNAWAESPGSGTLQCQAEVDEHLESILERYVQRVAAAPVIP